MNTNYNPNNRKIFLTGGAGVLGQALLKKINHHDVICLVNKSPIVTNKAKLIKGDISKPKLNLSSEVFNSIASEIDCIIHSAALTDFSKPAPDFNRINIEGTKNVLNLAKKANVPFFYISTAFVYKGCHNNGSFKQNNYEISKLSAEALVKESGLKSTIIRPSIIVGDSQTGAIAKFQGIHFLISLFMKGLLPVIPGSPESFTDFISQDIVAEAISKIVEQNLLNEEFWLTSGQGAIRLRNMADICIEQAALLTGKKLDLRMLDTEVFERLILPVFFPALPGRQRRMLESALTLARYLNIENPLPSSLKELESRLNVPLFLDPAETLVKNLEYWATINGFPKPSANGKTVKTQLKSSANTL